MKTNTAMTLYSRQTVNRAESWTRSVVPAVHWENRKAANILASGLLEADSVSVWIPGTSVTVKAGDVIVKGIVTDTVNSTTFNMSDLRKKYTFSFKVTSVDIYDYGTLAMQHIRVGAS